MQKEIIPEIIEGIQDRKGKDIRIIDLSKIEGASTGAFVVCNGTSGTQVSSIAESVQERVRKECGRKAYHEDGLRNSQWVVIDYGEVMVHIFLPEERQRYNLEELWGDATISEIPNLD